MTANRHMPQDDTSDTKPAAQYDVIIIGSGAGGATLAFSLRNCGKRVLVVERGEHLPLEPQNSDSTAVFKQRRYHTTERWRNVLTGRAIAPKEFYWVGGKTKVYGATLLRLREADFGQLEHREGVSPAWPITYDDLEPYYGFAEQLYLVHGQAGRDPNEPRRTTDYPYRALPESAYIHDLFKQLEHQGLTPFPLPLGIDYRPGGPCTYCRTCDGYPCHVHAKSDAEVRCLRPALEDGNVELMTGAKALKLHTNSHGAIESVEIEKDNVNQRLYADLFVVACGAIQSAALLLKSKSPLHPQGLGNSSGMVGCNLMFHNATGMVGIHPLRRNTARFQKSLCLTDFYLRGPDWPYPMGVVQLLGFYPLQHNGVPFVGRFVNERSIQFFALSEDLPEPSNRVELCDDAAVGIRYQPNNLLTHRKLVSLTRRTFRRAGYPVVASQFVIQPKDAGAHECGTVRFGKDPSDSVLDAYCRSHDVPNLYVVDASFFPSSGAMNPALTVIAQALRVGEHLGGMRIRPTAGATGCPAAMFAETKGKP